jgi:hypothetical protein
MMRTIQTGPVTALIAQVLLLAAAALAGTVGFSGVGLTPAGWVVGVTCGVITNTALARGLSHYRADRLGPADWVTLSAVRSGPSRWNASPGRWCRSL